MQNPTAEIRTSLSQSELFEEQTSLKTALQIRASLGHVVRVNNTPVRVNLPADRVNVPPDRANIPPDRVNVPPDRVPPDRVNSLPDRANVPPDRVNIPPDMVNEPLGRVKSPPDRVNEPPGRVNNPLDREDIIAETPDRVDSPDAGDTSIRVDSSESVGLLVRNQATKTAKKTVKGTKKGILQSLGYQTKRKAKVCKRIPFFK